MATTTTMTGAAFDQLPYEEARDLELLDGEVIEVSAAPIHQFIACNLIESLRPYLRRTRLGVLLPEVNFAIGENARLRPDIAILLDDHWKSIAHGGTPLPGAPDIAMEIISPTEGAEDSLRKVDRYLAAGSQEVWQFWPSSQRVFIYRSPISITAFQFNGTLTTPLLPGWEMSVQAVFELWEESEGPQ